MILTEILLPAILDTSSYVCKPLPATSVAAMCVLPA